MTFRHASEFFLPINFDINASCAKNNGWH